jgi:hypothetical protein
LILQQRHPVYLWGSYLILTLIFYWNTKEAGYITDFTGLMERIGESGPFGWLNSLNYPGLEQVLRLVQQLFFQWFGPFGWHWFLLFSILHSANAYFITQIGRQFSGQRFVGLIGGLLFLLSPFQTEVLVWKVCLNYTLSCFFVLFACLQAFHFIDSRKSLHAWLSSISLFLGLFSFELAICGPFLVVVLALAYWLRNQQGRFPWKQLCLPPPGLLIVYFISRRWLLGSWIGYYGAEVHLNTDPTLIAGNVLKYATKFLTFWRYWPHAYKESLYRALENPAILWPVFGFLFLLLMLLLIRFQKWSIHWKSVTTWTLAFGLSLGPVANLYCGYILHVENDRYGYLAAGFFALLLAQVMAMLPKWIKWVPALIWIGLSAYFLQQTNQWWYESDLVYKSLLDDFRWEDAPEVYVLAAPDNYKGILQFKDYSGEDVTIKDALEYIAGREVDATIYQVGQFNMATPADGVKVDQISENQLKVEFNQWGNWWWRSGIGTGSYKTPRYRFELQGLSYQFDLLETHPDAVFIYSDGGKWKEKELK